MAQETLAEKVATYEARRAARGLPPRPFPGFPGGPSLVTPASPASPAPAIPPRPFHRTRTAILAIVCGAVIFTGTIYGAGLKLQRDWKAEKKKIIESPVEDKVAILETQKVDRFRQRVEVQKKLARLRARMAYNAVTAAEAADAIEYGEDEDEEARKKRKEAVIAKAKAAAVAAGNRETKGEFSWEDKKLKKTGMFITWAS